MEKTIEIPEGYEAALERCKQWVAGTSGLNPGASPKEVSEYLFPELAESEDERVRKEIISFIKEFEKDHYRCIDFSHWIAYLERQKERKPITTGTHFNPDDYEVVENGDATELRRKQKEQKPIISAEESLGISQEEYNKIVDECIFDKQKDITPIVVSNEGWDCQRAYSEGYQKGMAESNKKKPAEWGEEDEHGKELLYVCQKTAEREHRSGVREGKAQAEKELIPLINRLCEAILFEWKDAADLARKTVIQIKAREE